jgi:GNAT superfamily N-acetyltransferase
LVAVDGGALRCFVVVKRQYFYERDFIDLLFVAEEHRRHGLGRDLMSAAVATALSTEVFTSTDESNAPMHPELVYVLKR